MIMEQTSPSSSSSMSSSDQSTSNATNSATNYLSAQSSASVTESEASFLQGVSSVVNGTINSYSNYNPPSDGFGSAMVNPQLNIPQQHPSAPTSQRRAITGAHNSTQANISAANAKQSSSQPQQSGVQSSGLFKSYSNSGWNGPSQQQQQQQPPPPASNWSSPQNLVNPWSSYSMNQKRPVGVPNIPPISPMKKSPQMLQPSMISPSKFRRSASMPMGKHFPSNMSSGNQAFDIPQQGTDTPSSAPAESGSVRDSNIILPFQVISLAVPRRINIDYLYPCRIALYQECPAVQAR